MIQARRPIAILITLALAMAALVSAAPGAQAQVGETSVSGVVQAGAVPLVGVDVSNAVSGGTSDANGEFAIESDGDAGEITLASAQTDAQPEFDVSGEVDYTVVPIEVTLPDVVQVGFTVQGGYYTNCETGGCDETFCDADLAAAGLCDEVVIEVRGSLTEGAFTGQWAAVGETVDNQVTLPLLDGAEATIYVNTIDAGAEEFVWDGSASMTLELLSPDPEQWYPDVDGDLFGDADAGPTTFEGDVPTGYSLDNTDCDDSDAAINPLADEIPGNAIDENCDGEPAPAVLEVRYDIVRENGEICPADFDLHTPGDGEPLPVDDGEEVTLCVAVRNNGPQALVDLRVDHERGTIREIAQLDAGADHLVAHDILVQPGDGLSVVSVTAADATGAIFTASDTAAVSINPSVRTVTGTIAAGGVPFEGVDVIADDQISTTNAAGEFAIEISRDIGELWLSAPVTAEHPTISITIPIPAGGDIEIPVDLPAIIQLEIQLDGGQCDGELAPDPCANEFFVEGQPDTIFGGHPSEWQSIDLVSADSATLAVLDAPASVRIYATGLDGKIVEWDGSNPFVINMGEPPPTQKTGRLLAGDVPLAGVEVFGPLFSDIAETDADGYFSFDLRGYIGPNADEVYLSTADEAAPYPFFDMVVLVPNLRDSDDFDIALPAVEQLEVRVNDPSQPGFVEGIEGEFQVRVLAELEGFQFQLGDWAVQAETVDGIATIWVFDSDFFVAVTNLADPSIGNGPAYTGESPLYVPLLVPPYAWYPDADGDLFGDPDGEIIESTEFPGGNYTTDGNDCDDTDPTINPFAHDIPQNGIDEDCSGEDAPPYLDVRLDVVQLGAACPADFASATPGIGEPLSVDAGDQATYCIAVINNGPDTITETFVSARAWSNGFNTFVGDMAEGEERFYQFDHIVQFSETTADVTVTAIRNGASLLATDQAAVDVFAPLDALITVGDHDVDLNGMFEVFVLIDPVEGGSLAGLEFGLSYDPAVIQPVLFTDPNEGTVGAPACRAVATNTIGICGPLSPSGEVRVTAFTLGSGWTEPTQVLAIPFVAQGTEGISSLAFNSLVVVDFQNTRRRATAIDGTVTVTGPDPVFPWYIDADGDEFGDAQAEPVLANEPPAPNFVEDNSDCNDSDPAINPAANEILGNAVDENCDGRALTITKCLGLDVTIDMRTGASGIGTSGDDVIVGTSGDDFIDGQGGNDVICGRNGNDFILGGRGEDAIRGGAGADTIFSGADADDVYGGPGDDVIRGQDGDDDLRGGSGNDLIDGQAGADDIVGGPDDDRIRGGIGNDVVRGGSGVDVISGGEDDDELFGNRGDDTLRGDSGIDRLVGGHGTDWCSRSTPDDLLELCELGDAAIVRLR